MDRPTEDAAQQEGPNSMDNIDRPTGQTHGTRGKAKFPTTTTAQNRQNAVSVGFSVEVARSVLLIAKIVSDVEVFTTSETCAEVESAGIVNNYLIWSIISNIIND